MFFIYEKFFINTKKYFLHLQNIIIHIYRLFFHIPVLYCKEELMIVAVAFHIYNLHSQLPKQLQ